MKGLLYLFVALAGGLTAVEAGANVQLAKTLGGPWWAALIFSAISAVLLVTFACFLAGPFPVSAVRDVPWWAWMGGVISAMFVLVLFIAPGVLGAGVFTGLTVTTALVVSIALDHWGLVGFPVHVAGLGRLLGAALMVVGLILVAAF